MVRVRQPNGKMAMSEPFDIERGVLQGDIFSPVSFIAGLDRIFRRHDISNSGVTMGTGENTLRIFEYARIDENVEQASARVTSIAKGSRRGRKFRKSNVMHVHTKTRVSMSRHSTSNPAPEILQRGLSIHVARWCDGGRTQRSRLGMFPAKRRAAEATLGKVSMSTRLFGKQTPM